MYDVTNKYTAEFLRGMLPDDVLLLLQAAQKLLFELKSETSFCPPEKPHLFGKIKKDIARIKTVMRESCIL